MKTYSEFLEYVKENIVDFMPPEYSEAVVDIVKMTKDNNMVLDGLTIRKDETSPSPVVYLEQYYGRIENSKGQDSILKEIASDYMRGMEYYAHLIGFDPSDWEDVRGKVGYYILNAGLNDERLKDKVYKTVGEFAKAYMIFMDLNGSGFNFTLITQDLLQEWDISMEELDEAAEMNMSVRFPPVLNSIEEDMKRKQSGRPAANYLRQGKKLKQDIMYVLTNRGRLHGASVLFYPGLIKKVRKILGKDFYIIPFSTEEIMISPKQSDVRAFVLEEILRENNALKMPNYILSNHIYEYDEESGYMKMISSCMA